MIRSWSLIIAVLGSSLLVGCKQDIGERCEQPSDCSSGYCGGDNSTVGMVSAAGKVCTPGRVTMTVDAGNPVVDTGTSIDVAQAADGQSVDRAGAEAGDALSESRAETGEAGSDVAAEAGSDASSVETGAETGAETSAADGAADLPIETAAGG